MARASRRSPAADIRPRSDGPRARLHPGPAGGWLGSARRQARQGAEDGRR